MARRAPREKSIDVAARRSRGGSGFVVLGASAIALGALAVTNHALARRSEARHPPRGRFLTVEGVRLHVLDEGTGPPLVLLHGNGVSSEDFLVSGLFQALARSHRVVAIDRPGFGYSERPRSTVWTAKAQAGLILAALQALGLNRPLVVAHSWGCFVACHMALQQPEALSGLVLMSGYYRPTVRIDSVLLAGPALPVIGDVMRFTASPVVSRLIMPLMLRQLFAPAPTSERFKADYPLSMSLRPWQLRAAAEEAGLMVREAAELEPEVPKLAVPVLVIAGRGDKMNSFEHQSEWLAGTLPSARLVAVPEVGHMVHHTAPRQVLSAIEGFHSVNTAQRQDAEVSASAH